MDVWEAGDEFEVCPEFFNCVLPAGAERLCKYVGVGECQSVDWDVLGRVVGGGRWCSRWRWCWCRFCVGEGAELGGLVGVVFLGEVECANVVAMCGCVDLQQGAVVPLERGG